MLWQGLHLDIWASGSISGIWVEDQHDSYRAQDCQVSSESVDGEIPRGGSVSSVYSAEIFDVVKFVLLPKKTRKEKKNPRKEKKKKTKTKQQTNKQTSKCEICCEMITPLEKVQHFSA